MRFFRSTFGHWSLQSHDAAGLTAGEVRAPSGARHSAHAAEWPALPWRCAGIEASDIRQLVCCDRIVSFGAAMPLRQGGQSCPNAAITLHYRVYYDV